MTNVILSINLEGLDLVGSQHLNGFERQQIYWLTDDEEGIEYFFCQPGGLFVCLCWVPLNSCQEP